MNIYGIYDSDGALVDVGGASDLSERVYVCDECIRRCARTGTKLLGRYTVKKRGKGMLTKKLVKLNTIATLYDKGLTAVQISAQSGLNVCTVWKYLHNMKQEGVLK